MMRIPKLQGRGVHCRATWVTPARDVRAAAQDAAALEHCARQLFEEAWSKGNVDVLDDVMAEGHVQRDMIWSGASSEGRDSMQRGVSAFRKFYPDLHFTIKNLSADVDNSLCFVEWTAEGTPAGANDGGNDSEGKESFGGASVLTIVDNQIVETRVYRKAAGGEMRAFLDAQESKQA